MPQIIGLGEFSNSQFKKAVKLFECSQDGALLDYLHKNAHSHHKQGFFQTYFYRDEGKYKAYISLASAQITGEEIALREKLDIGEAMPYPIPALKITRLCISDEFQRQNIGSILIEFAKIAAYEQQSKIGCRALLVDSKPGAIKFYDNTNFTVLSEMDKDTTFMFMDIPSLRSKEVKDDPTKKELVNDFIVFCEIFDLAHFSKTFEKMLTE